MKYLSKVINIFTIDIDPKRVYGLDILRAFAIVLVMYWHSLTLLKLYGYTNYKIDWLGIFLIDGASVFFVLSGFLIGGILIKIIDKKEFSGSELLNFWVRRWCRTLPAYFLILVIVLTWTYFLRGSIINNWYSYILFLQNFSSPHPDFFPEAWSLAVEEWFYILIPISLFISLKVFSDKKRIILIWIILTIILVTVYRIYRVQHMNISEYIQWTIHIRKQVVTRLDSMMFGFLGAYLYYYKIKIWNVAQKYFFVIGIILLITPQLYDYFVGGLFFKNYLTLTFTSLGTLLLIPRMTQITSGKGVLYKCITIISLISYSMYLINLTLIQYCLFPTISLFIQSFLLPHMYMKIIQLILFWTLTIGCSMLLYKYYEVPLTKLREKFKTL